MRNKLPIDFADPPPYVAMRLSGWRNNPSQSTRQPRAKDYLYHPWTTYEDSLEPRSADFKVKIDHDSKTHIAYPSFVRNDPRTGLVADWD